VDAEGCRIYFGGLISMFVFDILQIPMGALHTDATLWLRGCRISSNNIGVIIEILPIEQKRKGRGNSGRKLRKFGPILKYRNAAE